MGKFRIFIFVAAALFVFSGCRKESAGDRLRVTVSIEPQRWLVEQIGGDRVEVATLLDKNADPENFDPTLGTMRALEQASLFVMTGTNVFERELVGKMELGGDRVVDLSAGIEPVYGTHRHHGHDVEDGDDKGQADPHMWASVRNLRAMSATVRDALSKADPEGAELYDSNCNKLVAKLDSIDALLAGKLAGKRSRSFLMWHPALSYFARDYNLEQLWLGAEGKELSVKAVNEAMAEAAEHGAALLVTQPSDDKARSALLARNAGMRVVEINGMAGDIPSELLKLVDQMQ